MRYRRAVEAADARIIDVIEGDLVRVSTPGAPRPVYTVHLLGTDTPEAGGSPECGGTDARHGMLMLSFPAPQDTDGDSLYDVRGGTGARVTLTTDARQPLFDEAGSLLAYVDLAGDAPPVAAGLGTYDFGKTMIEAGLSPLWSADGRDFARGDAYAAAEAAASGGWRGLWSKCAGEFDRPL